MDWINFGARQLTLNDTIKTLNTLKDTYQKLGAKPAGFIQWLLTQDTAANFKTELTQLLEVASVDDDVTQLLEKLVDRLQASTAVAEQHRPLFFRLEQLDTNNIPSDVTFEVLNVSGEKNDLGSGDLSLALSGAMKAGIVFEGNAAELVEDEEHRAVSITFKGVIEAGVSGSLPLKLGSIGASAGLSAEGSFALQYVQPKTELFITALVSMFGDAVNPLNLSSIAAKTGEGSGFRKASMALTGAFHYGGELKLGYKNDLSPSAVLSAQAGVGFSTKLTGNFNIEVNAEQNGKVLVSVNRGHSHTNTRSFDLAVTVDASAVAAKVKSKIDEHLGGFDRQIQDLITKVNELTLPGEYLTDKLGSIVDELFDGSALGDDIKDKLSVSAKVALGVTSPQEAKAALMADLNQSLNNRLIIWQGSADDRASELTSLMSEKLGIPSDWLAGLDDKIKTKLGEIDADFDTEITAAVDGRVDAWVNKLGNVGVKVKAAATDLDESVKKVKDGIVKMLGRVQSKINEFTDLITNEERYKLEFKYTSELTRQSSESLMLQYQFDVSNGVSDAMQRCYELLLRGRADLIYHRPDVEGVSVVAGRLEQGNILKESAGLHISMFGMALENTSILDINSKVVRNAAGDIMAVSNAKYQEQFKFGGLRSSASFADAFNIVLAKYSNLDLNFAMSVGDVKLDESELDDILDALEAQKLISNTMAEDILADFDLMCGNKVSTDTLLTFKLPLSNAQVQYLLGIEMSESEIAQRSFIDAYNIESRGRTSKMTGRVLKILQRATRSDGDLAEIMYTLAQHQKAAWEARFNKRKTLKLLFKRIWQMKVNADAYVDLVLALRRIYLVDESTLDNQWLTQQQRIIGDAADEWINAFADLTMLFKPKISAETQRFVRVLIQSSGATDEQRAVLKAKVEYKDKSFEYE